MNANFQTASEHVRAFTMDRPKLLTILLFFLFQWIRVHSINITVPTGTNTLSQAISIASHGDIFYLMSGTYSLTQPIQISMNIAIIGQEDFTSVIIFDGTVISNAFMFYNGTERYVQLSSLVVKDSSSGNNCTIKPPDALNASATMDVMNMTLTNGFIHLHTGKYYITLYIKAYYNYIVFLY